MYFKLRFFLEGSKQVPPVFLRAAVASVKGSRGNSFEDSVLE